MWIRWNQFCTSDPFDLEKIQWLLRDFQPLDGIDQNLGALPRYRVWCVEGSAQPGHLGGFRFDMFKGTMMISMTNEPTLSHVASDYFEEIEACQK